MADGLDEHPLIQVLRETIRQANSGIYGLGLAAKVLVSSPADVFSLLVACLSDDALWHSIASRAYCHANGFAKFVLYDPAGSPFRLRLHAWTGEDVQRRLQEDQNVHGHRWNFGSAVVAGPGLHVEEFVVCEANGEAYRSYAYRSRPGAGSQPGAEQAVEGAELTPVGRALLRPSTSYALTSYGTYTCHVDTLHTVRPVPGGLTATLVLQGPTLRSHAPVYRRPDQPPQPAPEPMDDAGARQALAAVIAAMPTGSR
jgi:hypothetical protein